MVVDEGGGMRVDGSGREMMVDMLDYRWMGRVMWCTRPRMNVGKVGLRTFDPYLRGRDPSVRRSRLCRSNVISPRSFSSLGETKELVIYLLIVI
jgi:hypothetical protein